MNIKTQKKKEQQNERVSYTVGASAGGLAQGIMDIVARGAGVSLYRTRDGSAIGVTFMWGDLKEREFVPNVESLVKTLAGIVEQMDEMGAPPEVENKPSRRVKVATGPQ